MKHIYHSLAGLLLVESPSQVFAEKEHDVFVNETHAVSRLAFGSCLRNPKGAEILEKVVAYKPDVFVWLGDNVYIDTNSDTNRFLDRYGKLGANPRFKKLRDTCPNLAIWDDHDSGNDNVGKAYPLKEYSKTVFLEFWQVPHTEIMMKRSGVY